MLKTVGLLYNFVETVTFFRIDFNKKKAQKNSLYLELKSFVTL